jgi:hypothetical protein
MLIQVNTSNQVEGREALISRIEAEVTSGLARFETLITRVELHVGDRNADKSGADDKTCSLEVRLRGRRPEAVTHDAASVMEACNGAIGRMQRLLDGLLGRLGEPQREAARRRPRR